MLSVINNNLPWRFDRVEMTDDQLDNWMSSDNKLQQMLQHHNFQDFCYNLPIDSVDNITVEQYIKSADQYLFELVFEPVTKGFAFSPSEKITRVILAEKPMVVYAPVNFLQNLRNLGYKTFDSLWDESYDQLEGQKRHAAILSLVAEICSLPRFKQFEMYLKSRDIRRHNRTTMNKYTITLARSPG